MRLRDTMFSIVGCASEPCSPHATGSGSSAAPLPNSLSGRYTIRLHASHPIYQAHFPGYPITPGVCIIQIIGELLEEEIHSRLKLSTVANVKFIAPLSPVDDELVDVCFTSLDVDGQGRVKAKGIILAQERTMTKFSVIFTIEN